MLEDYLNQTCTVRYADGTNARGQPIYSEPHSVPCRLVQKYQLVNKFEKKEKKIFSKGLCRNISL